jgi:hypothetical protein
MTEAPVTLTYTNWRGETAERTILPQRVWFGATDWHPEPQWLLTAIDVEKGVERDFALKDFGAAPQDAMPETLERLRPYLDALPAGVWETWTSWNHRRITAKGGVVGGVLHAYNQKSDGQPDLSWTELECRAICEIVNALRAALTVSA